MDGCREANFSTPYLPNIYKRLLPKAMEQEELFYLIALLQVKGVGAITARNLIQHIGGCKAVFEEKPAMLARVQGIGSTTIQELKRPEPLQRAEIEMEFIQKNKITTFAFTEQSYPKRLIDCIDAPLLLYHKGNADLNCDKIVGMVGTRNATEYGKTVCDKFIEELSIKFPDVLILSGMAYGVDICAHKAALKNRLNTVGVMAHGLDRIYPAVHRKTAVEMINQGGLLTEFTSGTNPDRPNFVMRNRIVAGMCDALVVVESAERGGALITAEIANSYDRDVFAFPGRTNDLSSQGCNRLIFKNKAALIQNSTDFEELMGWSPKSKSGKTVQKELFVELSAEERNVTDSLKHNEPKQINILSIESNIPVYRLSSLLLELEFKSVVKCLPGGTYVLL
jgi:DNA processing protein